MKKILLLISFSIVCINTNAKCFFFHIVGPDTIIDGWSDLACKDFKLAEGIKCTDMTPIDNPTREDWVVQDGYAGPYVYNYKGTLYTFNFNVSTGVVDYLSYSGPNNTENFFIRIKYQGEIFYFTNHATYKAITVSTENMADFAPDFTISGSPNPVSVNCNVTITCNLENPPSNPAILFTVSNSSGVVMFTQTFSTYTFGFNTIAYPVGYYTIQAIINSQYYTSALIVKY